MPLYANRVYRAPALPREVLKWLQSLDITPLTNIKRDFCTGAAVSEILHWYYPKKIFPVTYSTQSSKSILENWKSLWESLAMMKVKVPMNLMKGTMYAKDGAAEMLVCKLYCMMTNRKLDGFDDLQDFSQIKFTDNDYQEILPMHARTTAIQAIRKNVTNTQYQLSWHDDIYEEAEDTIRDHHKIRNDMRQVYPDRFEVKLTLGQKAVRKLPKGIYDDDISADDNKCQPTPSSGLMMSRPTPEDYHYIEVQQTNKPRQMSVGSIHTLQVPSSTK